MRKKSNDIEVWYGFDASHADNLEPPFVLIWQSNTGWNDFGIKSECKFIAQDRKKDSQLEGEIYVGFLGNVHSLDGALSSEIERKPAISNISSKLPDSFTMLPAMQGYRNFVTAFGNERAKAFLTAMFDLVYLNYSSKSPKLFKAATASDTFKFSFMRGSEAFFTFHNAGSILDGLMEEEFGELSRMLTLSFKLDGFTNKHNLQFTFDHNSLLPKRIAIMIGENGVGKSQALSHFVNSLMSGSEELVDTERGRPRISRVLAIGTPGETRNSFPSERVKQDRVSYRRLNITRNAVSKPSRGFGELFVQLARSEESIKGTTRWQIFLSALQESLPVDEIAIQLESKLGEIKNPNVSVNREKYVYLNDFPCGGRIDERAYEVWGSVKPSADFVRIVDGNAFPLSSGQVSFTRFALQACLFVENGTMVLLDEPETHLHPSLIAGYIGLLDKLLELTGSLAILATHSAYFVREVPRTQVIVMRVDGNRNFQADNPRLKTFGADVGSVSYFVFEDELTNKLVEKFKKALAENPEEKVTLFNALKDELSSEATMAIKRELSMSEH